MKRSLITGSLVMIFLAVSLITNLAFAGGKQCDCMKGGMMHGGMMQGPGHDLYHPLMKHKAELGLNPGQLEQIEKIHAAIKDEPMEEMKTKMMETHKQLMDDLFDNTLGAEKVNELMKGMSDKMLENMKKHHQAMKDMVAVLTPEQKTKLKDLMKAQMEKKMEEHKEHKEKKEPK